MKSDNQFIEPKKTPGRFVSVRFEIENLSKDQLNFTTINVVDGQDRKFTPVDNVIGFVPNEEMCFFEQLNSNVPKVCQVIFEVPANAKQLKLVIGDLKLFGGESNKIDLGF